MNVPELRTTMEFEESPVLQREVELEVTRTESPWQNVVLPEATIVGANGLLITVGCRIFENTEAHPF